MGFSRGINYRGSQGLKRVATKHKDHAHRLRAKKAHLTSGFAKHLDSLRSSSRKLLKKLKGAKIEPEEPLEPSFDAKLVRSTTAASRTPARKTTASAAICSAHAASAHASVARARQ